MVEQKSPFRVWVSRAIRILFPMLSFGVLLWLLARIGWSSIADVATTVGPFGVFFLLALGVGECASDCVAIYYSMERRMPVCAAFVGNSTGAMLNWFIPLEAGEAYKIAYLSRYTSNEIATRSVLVWNYALKWTGPSIGVAAALVGFFGATAINWEIRGLVVTACLLALTPYVAVRLVLASGLALTLTRRLLRWIMKPERAEKFYATVLSVHEGVRLFRKNRPSDYSNLAISQLVAKGFSWSALYAASSFMGYPYSFVECAVICAAVRSMTYVTSALPARIGVSESAAYVLFESIGLPGEHGLLLILALRIKALLANGITNLLGSAGLLLRNTRVNS